MTSVEPKNLKEALAWVNQGHRLCVPSYTRTYIIDKKCLDKWSKAGDELFKEEGDGYRMRQGRSSIYVLPGQLAYID